MAAEYIMNAGMEKVILCERGIRTFETMTRNTFDVGAIHLLKHLSHLPVIVAPSHAAGRRDWVEPMSLAAAAAGADGVIVDSGPARELLRSPNPTVRRFLDSEASTWAEIK